MTLPDSGYWDHASQRPPCLVLWLVVGAVLVLVPAVVLLGVWWMVMALNRMLEGGS